MQSFFFGSEPDRPQAALLQITLHDLYATAFQNSDGTTIRYTYIQKSIEKEKETSSKKLPKPL